MFIHFYSIVLDNGYLQIIGYTEYLSKYFQIVVIPKSYEEINDINSTADDVIMKGDALYFCIKRKFFTQYIKSNNIIPFNYKKYNIPETVYLMIISLLSCRL